VYRLERWVARVLDGALFCLVRVVLVEPTWAELRERTYHVSGPPAPPGKISPAQARFIFEQEQLSDEHTDNKVRQLLTLTSALATLVSAIALSKFGRGVVALILIPLLATVYICLGGLLGVRVYHLPTASVERNEQEWARDMLTATRLNRGASALRVDLYRAALRWFLLALIVAPIAVGLEAAHAGREFYTVDFARSSAPKVPTSILPPSGPAPKPSSAADVERD